MNHVLLVTATYPPAVGAGGVRAEGLVKYLPEHGWRPTVLTTAVGSDETRCRVIEVAAPATVNWLKRTAKVGEGESVLEAIGRDRGDLARKAQELAFRWAKALLTYPDEFRSWIPRSVRRAEQERRAGLLVADAILSTSPGPSAHVIAARLASDWRVPWVADLRDPWSDNPYSEHPAPRRRLDAALERRVLAKAAGLTCVSEPLAAHLAERHGRSVETVPNGFDPDTCAVNSPPARLPLIVSYTGTLYRGRRDPEPLLEAVRRLLDAGSFADGDVELRFYGARDESLDRAIARHRLRHIATQRGLLPRPDALSAQSDSHVLLLLLWDDPRERWTVTAKVFEYLAANRRVLVIGHRDSPASRLIESVGVGEVFSRTDADGIAAFLVRARDQLRARGSIEVGANAERLARYSQPEMARRMADALGAALATGPDDRSTRRVRRARERSVSVPAARWHR